MTARILVADDVDANVKILEAKLKAAYYEVLTASNGVEALERTRADQPDLVLLDVMMPRMDGFECCSLLKADPETTRIPIVMVTALDQHADRLRGLEAGADDFLTKPPHDAALAARVRSLVRTKLRLEELRERERALSGLSDEPIIDLTAVRPEGRVILVEGREARARAMADALTATLPVDCVTAGDRGAALAAAAEAPPSLFVVSNRLGGDDGLRLCS
ncbi:MAG: response regulator, partial [Pseudomonadota bacterium]